jgi:CheY-like chemotaxis protein
MAPSRQNQTILLIEDDPNDVFLFERALKAANVTRPVQIVNDGETALAYLNGHSQFSDRKTFPLPSLVFLDLKLPTMSGFEILTWLRQQPRFKRLQVIVLTGSPLTIDIYRAYELGADAYLVKPISTETLASLQKTVDISWLSMATQKSGVPM